MPAKFDALNKSIADLTAAVTKTIGVQASATNLLLGVSTIVQNAVAQALQSDNAIDDTAAAAANAAVADALAKLQASTDPLAAAVAANAPPPPPVG